jgi:hypothetical protein
MPVGGAWVRGRFGVGFNGKFIGKGWLVDCDGNRFYRKVVEKNGEYWQYDRPAPGQPASSGCPPAHISKRQCSPPLEFSLGVSGPCDQPPGGSR